MNMFAAAGGKNERISSTWLSSYVVVETLQPQVITTIEIYHKMIENQFKRWNL